MSFRLTGRPVNRSPADTYAAAVAFARDEIARLRDEPVDLFGFKAFVFNEGDSKRFASFVVESYARWSAEGLEKTLSDAVERRWDIADAALRNLIGQMADDAPSELAAYNEIIEAGWVAKRKGRQRAPLAL